MIHFIQHYGAAILTVMAIGISIGAIAAGVIFFYNKYSKDLDRFNN